MRIPQTKQWTRRVGAVLAAVAMTVGITACGGGGDDGGGDKAYVEPKGPSTETISVSAKNYSFTPDTITADPGIATIELTAESGIHDFVFDGASSGFKLEADGGGGSQSKKIDLKPGKYTFYCSITGHRAQGMEGTLTVK
jgi:plastocyanin